MNEYYLLLMLLSNNIFLILTVLVILLSMFAFSKTTIERNPILPRLYLYIINFFVFYITFVVQKEIINRNEDASVKAFTFISNLFMLGAIYFVVISFIFTIREFYKKDEKTKELSNVADLTIVACLFVLITPGTSYLILSIIAIDLFVLFTQKTEIRYVVLILIWLFLILFNHVNSKDYSKKNSSNQIENIDNKNNINLKYYMENYPKIYDYNFKVEEDYKNPDNFYFTVEKENYKSKKFKYSKKDNSVYYNDELITNIDFVNSYINNKDKIKNYLDKLSEKEYS